MITGKISSDWLTVIPEEMIPYDIEKHPLHFRIMSYKPRMQLYTASIIHITFEFPNNINDSPSFQLDFWVHDKEIWSKLKNCGDFKSPIDQLPTKGTEYDIRKTPISLIVTRNGTEITNVNFADIGYECEKTWSNNTVWIKFSDSAKIDYRPHVRGKINSLISMEIIGLMPSRENF